MHKFLTVLLFVPALAVAAVYLNGTQIDADVRITTNQTQPPEPPTQPPTQPPTTDCPTTGRVPVVQQTVDLRQLGPQVEVSTTGITAGKLIGSEKTWHIAYGMRPGSTSTYKWAAIMSCPIFAEAYLVGSCAGSGSSTIAVRSSTTCKLERGKTYYLLFGAPNCTTSTCRAVRNIYGGG